MSGERGDPGFLHDLGASLRPWRSQPLLPVSSLIVLGLPVLLSPWPLLAWLVIGLFVIGVGWCGVEREWYLRAFQGQRMDLEEAFRLSLSFFWPFARLGLLVSVALVPVFGVALVFVLREQRVAAWTALVVGGVILDVVLTFVTPALAYDTPRALVALRAGTRMIFDQWPASAPYALVPGIALVLVSGVALRWVLGAAAGVVGAVLSTLVALALKGAIARFYLRRHPVWAAPRRETGRRLSR